jgi:quercetin dioxygenase-like cupin family protein
MRSAAIVVRLDPGWKSPRDNAPELGTENCPSPHRWYILGGKTTIERDDGTRETLEEGDIALIPPGHDTWTEGDEQVIAFEEVSDR